MAARQSVRQSRVRWFEGNFKSYEERRRAAQGEDRRAPYRIAYKRLVRGRRGVV